MSNPLVIMDANTIEYTVKLMVEKRMKTLSILGNDRLVGITLLAVMIASPKLVDALSNLLHRLKLKETEKNV